MLTRSWKITLAIVLILAMAGPGSAAPGQSWSLRTDGWYTPSKLAVEVKDYSIDWSKELAAGDDTIATCVWTFPNGITGGPYSISVDKKSVATWLSGGTAGQTYTISFLFTTTGGRTEKFSFKVEVK